MLNRTTSPVAGADDGRRTMKSAISMPAAAVIHATRSSHGLRVRAPAGATAVPPSAIHVSSSNKSLASCQRAIGILVQALA